MRDLHDETLQPSSALESDQLVFRAARSKGWIDKDNNRLLPKAYLLRKDKQEKGLTVVVSPVCPREEQAPEYGLTEWYGQARHLVGPIRDLNLEIVNDKPNHWQIEGMPFPEDDLKTATDISHELAEQGHLVWPAFDEFGNKIPE